MARATRHQDQAERGKRSRARHPHSVATLGDGRDETVEQPFIEGAQDATDPDLRHRLISESAYRRYTERGYAEGYDLDDWLEAEAEVDHLLLRRTPPPG